MRTKRVWFTGDDGRERIITMNVEDDPYHDYHPYHKAVGNTARGVIALCQAGRKHLRPINMKRETWALLWRSVTCPRCLKLQEAEAEIIASARSGRAG